MALPLAAGLMAGGIGAGLVGGFMGAESQKQAADALLDQYNQGLISLDEYQQKAQEYMQQQTGQAQEMLAPGQEAWKTGLQQYQEFMDPSAQSQYARDYMSSQLGRDMARQAEQTTARTASATGALRTSDTANALAAIRPQMMQQAVGQRMAGLQNLVSMGAPTVGQGANLAANLGANVGGQLFNVGQANLGVSGAMGAAQGEKDKAYLDALAAGVSDVGGLALYQGLA